MQILREIILDTETTGLDHKNGDRLVEIGCVEIYDCIPTGRTYQQYINPLREVSERATQISGITSQFLLSYPTFDKIADEFLSFIGDTDALVIHNAPFDMGFINMELGRLGKSIIPDTRVIDTLKIARSTVRSVNYSLDALCTKFNIDRSNRTLHGALIDCELLAKVYLELKGGRQRAFAFNTDIKKEIIYKNQSSRMPRSFPLSDDERESHLNALKEIKNPMWSLISKI